jgi:anion-transporting  ArsA/GET3 family ATPase
MAGTASAARKTMFDGIGTTVGIELAGLSKT